MKLLPYYSDTPIEVASIVFDAIKKGKKVEMVSVFNYGGLLIRSVPPVANAITWLANKVLTR